MKIWKQVKATFLSHFFPSESILNVNSHRSHDTTRKLRILFLTPLATILLIAFILFIITLSFYEESRINSKLAESADSAISFYNVSINNNINALKAMSAILENNTTLQQNFENANRQALLENSEEVYSEIDNHFDVTHFYYIEPNGTTFLRVHLPSRYGDIINRETWLHAKKTNQIGTGIELGP